METRRVLYGLPARRLLGLLALVSGPSAVVGTALAQEAGREVSTVDTESGATAGPQDLPGQIKGSRERPKAAPEVVGPGAREWFGFAPWGEWSRITGDWGGPRTRLEDQGLTLSGSLIFDWSGVWSGGLSRRASTRSLLDINASLDLDRFAGVTGGTAHADFQSTDVRGGSRDVGDAQGIDSIDSGENIHQLSEAWYEQRLLDGAFRVKAGKIDANLEFNTIGCAGSFLHACAGANATMLTFPAYPDPALGALLFWYPVERAYLGAGFFDGSSAAGVNTGRQGPRPLFHGDEYYLIGEAGVSWKGAVGPGRGAAGGWVNTAAFERFDGTVQRAAQGLYLLGEQRVLAGTQSPDDDSAGVFVFARYGRAEERVSEVRDHAGAGLVVRGTFRGRGDDSAGFFVSFARLSRASGAGFVRDETALETFYRGAVTPFLAVTGDIQVIVNPGGTGAGGTAVVGGLRFEASF